MTEETPPRKSAARAEMAGAEPAETQANDPADVPVQPLAGSAAAYRRMPGQRRPPGARARALAPVAQIPIDATGARRSVIWAQRRALAQAVPGRAWSGSAGLGCQAWGEPAELELVTREQRRADAVEALRGGGREHGLGCYRGRFPGP